MKLRVSIAGATGWVGKPLSVAISQTSDLELVGAIARSHAGSRLQQVTGDAHHDFPICASVEEALHTATDVLVDYTSAVSVKSNVLAAIRRGVHVVVGSSGLTEEDFAEINQAALEHKVGVVAAGNFAITAVLLQRFACEAAKYLSQWEIIDYASDSKIDVPSGTVRELAFRMSEIAQAKLTHAIEDTVGPQEARGASLNGSQIHSIRLPGHVLGVEVLFGATDERLSIRHDAGSGATPYIQGTLLAIRHAKNHLGLVRGLDRVMESA